jgi:hypothetical protein
MRELLRTAAKIVLSGFALSLAALGLAAIAVRSSVMWPLFPEWVFKLTVSAMQPHTQEAAADAEFLGFWLVCLAAVTLCAVVLASALQCRKRQRNEHA